MAEEGSNTQIYHERQRLQFCLLHSLNNLFQEKDAFTRANLNAIAEKLVVDDPRKETWSPLSLLFKPHHNALSGNYDINVLIAALGARGRSVVWHDRRNGASTIDLDAPDDTLMGIVINIPVKRYGLWKGRHWVTLRRIGIVWYNLDSDLVTPYSFKDTEEVKDFLDDVIHGGGTKDNKTIDEKQNSGSSRRLRGSCRFRLLPKTSGFSPVSFLKHIGEKVATAFRVVSMRKRSSSTKVSASGNSKTTFVTPVDDSHRTEAVKDCIEFINSSSSSSLQRSNSVPDNPPKKD